MRFYRGDSRFETVTRKRMRRFLLALPILLTAYLFLAGDSGIFRVWDRAGQIAEVRGQISALRVENERMVGEVDLLKNDLKTIERIARERFGMVKPNESVYMVYPGPPAKKLP
jgi:cell division protein FtsB